MGVGRGQELRVGSLRPNAASFAGRASEEVPRRRTAVRTDMTTGGPDGRARRYVDLQTTCATRCILTFQFQLRNHLMSSSLNGPSLCEETV